MQYRKCFISNWVVGAHCMYLDWLTELGAWTAGTWQGTHLATEPTTELGWPSQLRTLQHCRRQSHSTHDSPLRRTNIASNRQINKEINLIVIFRDHHLRAGAWGWEQGKNIWSAQGGGNSVLGRPLSAIRQQTPSKSHYNKPFASFRQEAIDRRGRNVQLSSLASDYPQHLST